MPISSVMSIANAKSLWLSARQELLAQNVANLNTPAYVSKDLVPFNEVMKALPNMSAEPQSMTTNYSFDSDFSKISVVNEAMLDSGNNVSLETELLKIGETTSQYSFNTNIIKSFHRMFLASLKG